MTMRSMKAIGKSLLGAVAVVALLLGQSVMAQATTTTAPLVPDYSAVTEARLLNPEPENWLIYKGNYSQHAYSPLDQITTDNVSDLVPVWTFSTGVTGAHEGAPIVNDGIMFATGAYSTLFVMEAATGKLLWSYARDLPQDVYPIVCCGLDSRGVALWGNNVYITTLDAHLLAFDVATGKMLWDQTVADYTKGYAMTMAPLAVNGKIMVGVAGGEYGIRGFVEAFDADTGDSVWQSFTTAAPDQPGGDTWPGDTYEHGAAAPWVTGSYDPETNLTYWGTSNGGPWMGQVRPGDNLYVASVVAMDADTGEIKAFYQYSPNETWDYDETSDQTLVNVMVDGKQVKGLIHAGRNGQFYLLDRENTLPSVVVDGQVVSPNASTPANPDVSATAPDRLGFIYGETYMKAQPQVITGFDDEGRPIIPEEHRPAINKAVTVCPNTTGGDNWTGLSFSPDTGYAYIPTQESCKTMSGVQVVYQPGQRYIGAQNQLLLPEGLTDYGALQAIDVATGKVAWRVDQKLPVVSPPLSTHGGLVFIGDAASREFRAFDAKTGKELWHFTTNSSVVGVPTSFEVDGVQYVAVESSGGNTMTNVLAQTAKLANVPFSAPPQGGVIWVFALKDKAAAAQAAAAQ